MRLPTDKQIHRVLDLLEKRGVEWTSITFGKDGITIGRGEGLTSAARSAFDDWKERQEEKRAQKDIEKKVLTRLNTKKI